MNTELAQLVSIYYNHEYWHKNKMPKEVAYRYHKFLVEQGSIQYYEELGVVLGYYELWLINEEQLKRIVLGKPLCADGENITDGNIAFLANCWIDRSFRSGRVFKELYKRFMQQTEHCEIICGEQAPKNFRLRMFRNRRKLWEAPK